jgi:hypothetical protein
MFFGVHPAIRFLFGHVDVSGAVAALALGRLGMFVALGAKVTVRPARITKGSVATVGGRQMTFAFAVRTDIASRGR